MKELSLQEVLDKTQDLGEKKVGFVSIIGRPNSGKSTFMNQVVGEKIAITSDVPQTTRNQILGILTGKDYQIIFTDTPGIHKNNKKFNEEINLQATSSLENADVILYFVDISRKEGEEEKYIQELLKGYKDKVFTVYTKIDIATGEIPEGENIYSISSKMNLGITELIDDIKKRLPTGPMLYSEDMETKQTMSFRISEIIREKLFLELKEELPHSVFVEVDEIEQKPDITKILAYIYTETESQKYIVIGNKGSLLTKVGKAARIELEDWLDTKVFLSLRVKVKKNWRKDEKFIKNYFNQQ